MGKAVVGFATVAAALLASAGFALAATTVNAPQGGLMLSHAGKGFKPVTGSVVVGAGDRVMVANGSAATVLYDGGCSVPVEAGKVLAIQFVPPCAMAMEAPPAPPAPVISPFLIGGIVAGVGGLTYLAVNNGWGSSNNSGSSNPGGGGNGGGCPDLNNPLCPVSP